MSRNYFWIILSLIVCCNDSFQIIYLHIIKINCTNILKIRLTWWMRETVKNVKSYSLTDQISIFFCKKNLLSEDQRTKSSIYNQSCRSLQICYLCFKVRTGCDIKPRKMYYLDLRTKTRAIFFSLVCICRFPASQEN